MNTSTKQGIEENRTSEVELTVKGGDGQPLAGQGVTVRMIRHKFLFGCNAYYLKPDSTDESQQAYQQHFADLFNYATLSFYWGRYEPEEGKVEEESRRSQAEWLHDHGIVSKGHPLAWYMSQPKWVPQGDPDALWEIQKQRCARETAAFAGTIDVWDVLNEMARIKDGIDPDHPQIDKNFRRMWEHVGPVEMIKGCFEAAAEGNPKAKLILNDYDLTDIYARIIDDCLEAGVKIDYIGIQSHWHAGTLPADEQLEVLERFSRFGIEFSPVPIDVEAVTIFFPARRSSCGISLRCAAVKAPDVITLNSSFVSATFSYASPKWDLCRFPIARECDTNSIDFSRGKGCPLSRLLTHCPFLVPPRPSLFSRLRCSSLPTSPAMDGR